MSKISSASNLYTKQEVDLGGADFSALMARADVFIFAAGFEARARRVPSTCPKVRNVLTIAYEGGPYENDESYKAAETYFQSALSFEVCVLNLAHVEKFEAAFEKSIQSIKAFESGELVMDISGMPNFAICIAIAKIRHVFPAFNLTILYTEAEEYFPTKDYYNSLKKKSVHRTSDLAPDFLSTKAVTMFMPSIFSGVTLGQNDTCLIVYAGYEPHRTICAIEALNPNKIVIVYGVPGRKDLAWRLELSKIMHLGVDEQIKHAQEESSTSNVSDNLALLLNYYEHLYDDHTLAVSPINGKIQAVAAVIAWETYPDIQLNFPIPAEYLPKRFSANWGRTFSLELGPSIAAQRFAPTAIIAPPVVPKKALKGSI